MLIIIKLTNSLISSEVTLLMFKQNIKLPLECFFYYELQSFCSYIMLIMCTDGMTKDIQEVRLLQ